MGCVLSIQVDNNGLISFLGPVSTYTSDPFPLGDDRRLIAPYWGDVNTKKGGTVWYREVVRDSHSGDLFTEADQIIERVFVDFKARGFKSSWMYIATWDQVAFYGSTNSAIVSFSVGPITIPLAWGALINN